MEDFEGKNNSQLIANMSNDLLMEKDLNVNNAFTRINLHIAYSCDSV